MWVSPRAEPPPSATPIRGPEIVLMPPRSLLFERSRSATALPRSCSGVRGSCDGVSSKTLLRKGRLAKLRKGSRPAAGNLAPADIAAAEAFWPINLVHACISTALRLFDVLAQGGDVENATTGS